MRSRAEIVRIILVALMVALAVALLVALVAITVALAQGADGKGRAGGEVDLQLVLAVDTSGSVNTARFELQKQGYVQAFRSQRLLAVIGSGSKAAIAVTMMQWTGPSLQVVVVPWTRIDSEASMLAFAAAIEAAPRQLFSGGTSISGAIDHAVTLFASSGATGGRRVIDVSGDGINNRGRPAAQARDEAVRGGIGINGLPITELEFDLEGFYREHVIGGPEAFVVVAESYATFAEAVLKKLVTEIATVSAPHAVPGKAAALR